MKSYSFDNFHIINHFNRQRLSQRCTTSKSFLLHQLKIDASLCLVIVNKLKIKFSSCVNFPSHFPHSRLGFPLILDFLSNMKCDTKSESLRADGNKFYSERKFFDAILKYNESLCHASQSSENLGLAFANRSAVYFEMKLFDKSLKNIEAARTHNYPMKNFDVLKRREEKCHELMKQKMKLDDPWSIFKLSYKPNKKLPLAVDCLELRVDGKYGKHIVTSKSLSVGDVLAVENPFCSVLLSESRFIEVDKSNKFQRCAFCLKDNQLDLLPCGACCEGDERANS